METLAKFNLIALLDFYLIITFLLGTILRYRQYRAMIGLIFGFPGRWPKLLQLTHEHRLLFLSWPTLLPLALMLVLTVVNLVASKLIWTQAHLSPPDLWRHPVALIFVLLFAGPMLYLDFTAVFCVWKIDRPAVEKDLDHAEYWLRSWVSPAVNILTLGYVNPRKMVHEEVRKALTNANLDMNRMMWRWALQIAVRFAFGMTLWLTWALTPDVS
jgi:hypothetical protein